MSDVFTLVENELKASQDAYDNSHRELVRIGLRRRLPADEATPGLMAFMDNLSRVSLVLGLARESESIFRLAIGDLVDPAYPRQ